MIVAVLSLGLRVAAAEDIDICKRSNSPTLAIAACDRMIATLSAGDARLVVVFANRGLQHLNIDLWDDAIRDFDRALSIGGPKAFLLALRGVAWSRKKDFDRAIADYNQALRLNPKDLAAEILYNRGIAHGQKSHFDDAISDYNSVIRLDANNVQAYTNRGLIFKKKGQLDLARADFEAALAVPLTSGAETTLQQEARKLARVNLSALLADPARGGPEPRASRPVLAQETNGNAFGRWVLKCEEDRMTDERKCVITLNFSGHNPQIVGSLTTVDLGQSFFVVAQPFPMLAQMRVDKNPAHAAKCGMACNFDGDNGQRLGRELSAGSELLLSVMGLRGNLEQHVPISSFGRAVAAGKKWISR
jgi:Tfp pilus assembly protein PilF